MPEAVGKLWSSICAQKVLLDFLNLRTKNAAQRYQEEAIEKTILRILASCAFSHSLAPEPTYALQPDFALDGQQASNLRRVLQGS
jgi:hypothetical protein